VRISGVEFWTIKSSAPRIPFFFGAFLISWNNNKLVIFLA
jgi:hypothetical protein